MDNESEIGEEGTLFGKGPLSPLLTLPKTFAVGLCRDGKSACEPREDQRQCWEARRSKRLLSVPVSRCV